MGTARISYAAAHEGSGPEDEERHYVGIEACRPCHVLEAEHWSQTLHAAVFEKRPSHTLGGKDCEACHGPGSKHLVEPNSPEGIIGYTRKSGTPINTQNDRCLQCHTTRARLHWFGSGHEVANLGCSDCHDPMTNKSPQGLLRMGGINETCFSCHPRQRVEFRKRSHMPLVEGKLTCVDCHDPHGSPTRPLLRADDVNQLCYQCHAEKRGPFIYEHAPVRESCLNCHLPHGSNRERLLNASLSTLCQQCHVQQSRIGHASALMTRGNLPVGVNPDERIMNRGCVNCHTQVHGSNHPSGARQHR